MLLFFSEKQAELWSKTKYKKTMNQKKKNIMMRYPFVGPSYWFGYEEGKNKIQVKWM